MQKNHAVDMGSGAVFSTLLRLGTPALISMFFETLYGLVDSLFVARLGTIPLAAMSLALPLFYVGLALSKGLSSGALALMSHARGQNRPEEAAAVAGAGYPLLLLVTGAFLPLALPVLSRPLFALFDSNPLLLDQTTAYTRWLILTYPGMALALFAEAIFFSHGDTRTPMLAMIAGNLCNMVLDPLFIFGCGLGGAGASLASLFGWLLSALILVYFLRRRGYEKPGWRFNAAVRSRWPAIRGLGLPIALSLLILPISNAIFNYLLAACGPAYVGAWNLSTRIERMVVLPLYGITSALVPFVAFNLGRSNLERIKRGCFAAIAACEGLVLPAVIFILWQADFLIGLFKPSPEVATPAVFALRVACSCYLFGPFELCLTGLAQGLKKPRYSLIINSLRVLLLRLPLALIFLRWRGGIGIYISHPLSAIITGGFSFFLLRHLLADEQKKLGKSAENC